MFPNNLQLIFATNNQHKLKEIKLILNSEVTILSLKDIDCSEKLPETSSSLRGNALQKANYVFEKYGVNCFADDTGLEIDALSGRPGVYSARYAGLQASDSDNVAKVLNEMKGVENRTAIFKTVIALITDREQKTFEGMIEGEITNEPKGTSGFGYDPVFIPAGSTRTFAEMSEEEKNGMSHRARALEKLIVYLKEAYVIDKSN